MEGQRWRTRGPSVYMVRLDGFSDGTCWSIGEWHGVGKGKSRGWWKCTWQSARRG